MKKVPYTLSENSVTIFWDGKPYTQSEETMQIIQLATQGIA